jgi:asparagine synthase (glutamine-hydrolysing)
MCGITGLINCGDEQALSRMAQIIAYRGPDDYGIKWFGVKKSGLAHRRLSIIDLSSAGHQPMSNLKGNLWITYNGEIYNYREIRNELSLKGYKFSSHTDTEVILYGYEEWGIDCLKKFNGMFAFAIYDSNTGKVVLVRDRLGIKPLYYFANNTCMIFASEIKAILAAGIVPAQPDYYSLHTPTRFQIEPYTGFKDISKVPPGHYLVYEHGKLLIQRYWGLTIQEESPAEQAAIETLDELLKDSVRLQMIADVPVGVLLSGGLDSSLISALMKGETNKPIHSFTIKFTKEDQKFEKMPDDSYYARLVAKQFGFIHHEFEIKPDIQALLSKLVWHLDEPLADPAAINTYLISKAARDMGIPVLLNGVGGDEVFGGYRKQLACLKADLYQSIIPSVAQRMIKNIVQRIPVATSLQGLKTLRWLKRFLSFASLPQAERFLVSDLSLTPEQYSQYFVEQADYYSTHYYQIQQPRLNNTQYSYLTRMCFNDTLVMLPEHNLLYADKASMAASIESRPPLLDHRVVEFMFSLSPDFKIKRNVQKYLLKRLAKKYLLNEIINRPKAPFGSPLRSWIRGPLHSMVTDLLSEESIKNRGLYNHAYVHKLIKNDKDGIEDNAHIIWTLLTNEIWFRTFFGD